MYFKYQDRADKEFAEVSEDYVKEEVTRYYKDVRKIKYKPSDINKRDNDNFYPDVTLTVFRIKNSNDGISLDYGGPRQYGMTHILARHSPEYWTGEYNGYGKDPLSKFDPRTSMKDIEKSIQNVMDDGNNPKRIQQHIDENKFSKKAYYGKSGGKKYKLIIDSGSIVTVYPDGWNVVED